LLRHGASAAHSLISRHAEAPPQALASWCTKVSLDQALLDFTPHSIKQDKGAIQSGVVCSGRH
jgi:hypothetical protein